MIPLENVFMLNIDCVIDQTTLDSLRTRSSDIPVFSGTKANIMGALKTKNLISKTANTSIRENSIQLINHVKYVNINESILSVLKIFQQSDVDIICVVEEFQVIGIVHQENILKLMFKEIQESWIS